VLPSRECRDAWNRRISEAITQAMTHPIQGSKPLSNNHLLFWCNLKYLGLFLVYLMMFSQLYNNCTALNGRATVNDKLVRMWLRSILRWYSQHLPGRTKKNHEKPERITEF
jgi:hypothetical protein